MQNLINKLTLDLSKERQDHKFTLNSSYIWIKGEGQAILKLNKNKETYEYNNSIYFDVGFIDDLIISNISQSDKSITIYYSNYITQNP